MLKEMGWSSYYFVMISALQVETKVGSLLLNLTRAVIYGLLRMKVPYVPWAIWTAYSKRPLYWGRG